MADFSKIKIGNSTFDVKDATAARKGMYVGTCPSSATIGGSTVTMASSADKVVTVDTFPTDANDKPLVGTIIGVKYATSNTYKTDPDNNKPEAAHRINVNNTGFIQIYYNNAALKSGTSANTLAAGYKNRYIYYQYDGTYWVWLSAGTDTNTTYAGYSFGLGLGVQNNSSASATITVTLSNYALATGGVTSVRFLYDVPASATMNINSKGAKSIYYKNSAITAGVIKAGDTATFVYSGQYHLIAIDRWDDDIKAKAPFIVELTATETNEQISVSTSTTFAQIKAAHDAGRVVIARVAGQTDFLLTSMLNDEATFSVATTQAYSSTHYLATLRCTNQDVWTVITSPFADVAFSGSYNDLSNKPTIPTSSDINAAKPLIVTLGYSNGAYTCDTSNADIYAAWQAGKSIICTDGEGVYQLTTEPSTTGAWFGAVGYDDKRCYYVYYITTTNGTQSVSFYSDDIYTFDNSPTVNSNNPVKSGGVYTALAGKANKNGSVSEEFSSPRFTAVNEDGESASILSAYDEEDDKLTLIFTDSLRGEGLSYTFNGDGNKVIATTDDVDAKADKALIANLEIDDYDNDGNPIFTCDTAYDELIDAIEDGRQVLLFEDVEWNIVLHLAYYNGVSVEFCLSSNDVYYLVDVKSDDSVTYRITEDKRPLTIITLTISNGTTTLSSTEHNVDYNLALFFRSYNAVIKYNDLLYYRSSYDFMNSTATFYHYNAASKTLKALTITGTDGGNDTTIYTTTIHNDVVIPSLANNLTTTTAGSALDATQGKALKDLVDAKQATLVSGTNIKSINNQSLLGSGNIDTNPVVYLWIQDATYDGVSHTVTFTDNSENTMTTNDVLSVLHDTSKDVRIYYDNRSVIFESRYPRGANDDTWEYFAFHPIRSFYMVLEYASNQFTATIEPHNFLTIEDNASAFVTISRTINNKALSSDITLTASDVGAEDAQKTTIYWADNNGTLSFYHDVNHNTSYTHAQVKALLDNENKDVVLDDWYNVYTFKYASSSDYHFATIHEEADGVKWLKLTYANSAFTATTYSHTFLTQSQVALKGADNRLNGDDLPKVMLDSVSSILATAINVGKWFYNSSTNKLCYIKATTTGTAPQEVTTYSVETSGDPSSNVIYYALDDGKFYRWDGTDMVEISSGGGGGIIVETVSGTGDVVKSLEPNIFYKFGTVDSLTIPLIAGTELAVYAGKFTISSNSSAASFLVVPSTVTVAYSCPTISVGNTYEFSIADNVLLMSEV